MPVARIAAHLRGGEGEHRPQALSPGVDQMPGEFGDQVDIGAGPVEDDAVDMGHVLLDKRDEGGKARTWISRAGKFDDNSQRYVSSSARKAYCRDIVGGRPRRSRH